MASFPHRPYGPERRALPVDEWPRSDAEAWRKAQTPGAFLENPSRAATWAAESRYRVEHGYGRYLRWLLVTNQLASEGGLKSRLTRPLVAAFVQDLLAVNTAQTVIARLNALHRFARATQPDEDWSFLWQLQRPLQPKVRDSREKAARLRHTAELIQLARSLMSSLPKDCSAQVPFRAAIAYRDGMMIGLLALRPLRLRNFTAITLGRHLVQRTGAWWLLFAAEETKTKRSIETPFPRQLLESLETYLSRVRPALLQRGDAGRHDDGRLWLGWDGRPLPARRVHQRISHRTERAFGRSMFPHLFRDAGATTIALEDPEHVRIAAQVLGHGSFHTTEAFYRMSRGAEAVRAHNDLLDSLRAAGAKR
jgi:integrase